MINYTVRTSIYHSIGIQSISINIVPLMIAVLPSICFYKISLCTHYCDLDLCEKENTIDEK